MTSTRITRHINAPAAAVYRALLDPRAVAKWKVPGGTGKTTAHTDTYHGRFVTLVPNEQIVEVDEFETDDPALGGKMTITITLRAADGGTDLLAVHEPVAIKVYPGVQHSFDSPNPVRYVATRINPNAPGGRGATTGGDATAWADSIREVVAFFDRHLTQATTPR